MKKNRLQSGTAACMAALLLSSCLNNKELEVPNWVQDNCQIASFSLKNDSIRGLAQVVFTIDQIKGEIYNRDSMPYGTVINRKIICNVKYDGPPPSAVEVYQETTKERKNWNGSDSLDLSKPIRFDVYSYNGKSVKTYTAKLNVHQQKPDSMTWLRTEKLLDTEREEQRVLEWRGKYRMFVCKAGNDLLYQSDDAKTWIASSLNGLSGKTLVLSQITVYGEALYAPAADGLLYRSDNGTDWSIVGGAPEIKVLLGVVDSVTQSSRPSALAAIVKNSDSWHFASMNAKGKWTTGETVPEAFPFEGFGTVGYEAVFYRHLLVIAGKKRNGELSNLSWETTDGLRWVSLNHSTTAGIEPCEGAAVSFYDNQIYLIGGFNASKTASRKIYRSANRGLSWTLVNKLIVLPETFQPRGYASLLVDKDNYMLLFGGKEKHDRAVLDELWRGRINRLGFKE